jgi:hypothetical protein
MHSADIYPLTQRLYALIPEPLRRWTGTYTEPEDRDRLADALGWACEETGLGGPHTHAMPEEAQPIDQEGALQAMIIAEGLAGFVTMWGCRYGNLDEDVDRGQAALVTALGGEVIEPGHFALAVGTPLTVAAIAHLIGWVCVLDVPEADQWPS